MAAAALASLRSAALTLLLSSCVGGTSSAAGDPGGGGGGTAGAGTGTGAGTGVFPEAAWTVALPQAPVFAAMDDQHFSITGASVGHLLALDASGSPRYERDTGQLGCVARGDAGETAVVIDNELQFLDLNGTVVWTQPSEQPCQLTIAEDRVVLGEASGVRIFNINGESIGPQINADLAVLAPTNWRRTLDADGVIGYANLNTIGALTNDGEPLFELDVPDLEVHAIRVAGVDVVAAVSFANDANICGQVVSPGGNTRAALIAFAPSGQCSWNYVFLNQGAAPQSTVIRDLAIAGTSSLYATGTFEGSLSWGTDSLTSGNFLVELKLENITPIRATDALTADSIDASSDGRVLVVSDANVSLLFQ